jgi:hypothetical protein
MATTFSGRISRREPPNDSCKLNTNAAYLDSALLLTHKGALDSQKQVIQFTSCLPMIGGSLRLVLMKLQV